jgi:putative ABC transport system substrate-binding protein
MSNADPTMKEMIGLLLALSIAISFGPRSSAEQPKVIFGVMFEGCELICEGFKAKIAETGFPARLVVRDLGQDKTILPRVVEEAREMQADLILTVGTSATLGTIGTLDDAGNRRFIQDIPTVFTFVADPFSTRIAESYEGSGRSLVAGTFNRVPEAVNIKVIRQYDPEFKKLGLLFNSNERNSTVKKEEISQLASELGFELVAMELDPGNPGAPNPELIPLRMAALAEKGIRWVYLGSSSFLRWNASLFTGSAVRNGIAVLSPYEGLVRDHQALLSIAARERDVGRLAGDQALKILRDGMSPGDLPIVRATDFAYVVNMEVARTLDRFPPVSFLEVAETVK